MFRNIYFNEDITIKIDLYKNRREKVCEIPLDYVENIVYKCAKRIRRIERIRHR